jgi:ADP-ribose pyrophosphatase
MVDPGEKVSVTLKREFMEEALNSEDLTEAKRNELHEKLRELFDNGVEVLFKNSNRKSSKFG